MYRVWNLLYQPARRLHLTSHCYAEPLRKKKTIDPLVAKKQFERKIRKLEREIYKLQSIEPKLKPILEQQLPPQVLKDYENRVRKETDQSIPKLMKSFLKVWCIYKNLETQSELKYIRAVAQSQEKTMNLLKKDYSELYNSAIQLDPELIPYTVFNVKKDSPPSESYNCPDGNETDTTKQWKL